MHGIPARDTEESRGGERPPGRERNSIHCRGHSRSLHTEQIPSFPFMEEHGSRMKESRRERR